MWDSSGLRDARNMLTCVLAVQDVGLVQPVHLLQEDEGEDSVRAEASVIRREAFPEREEAFGAHDLHQHLLMEQHGNKSEERERLEIPVKQ